MRKAEIKFHDHTARWLIEDENGYTFLYEEKYLENALCEPISLTLPLGFLNKNLIE